MNEQAPQPAKDWHCALCGTDVRYGVPHRCNAPLLTHEQIRMIVWAMAAAANGVATSNPYGPDKLVSKRPVDVLTEFDKRFPPK